MEKKKNNINYLFYTIIMVVILIGVTIAVTYAYFSVSTSKSSKLSNIEETMECIDIEYSEVGKISLDYNYPITDTFALNNIVPVTVTVTNNCTNNTAAIPYTLAITSLKTSTGYLSDGAVRFNVSRKVGSGAESTLKSTNYLNTLSKLTSGNTYTYLMNDLNTRDGMSTYTSKTTYIIDDTTIANNTINVYKVYLWIDYYEGDTTQTGLNNNTVPNQQSVPSYQDQFSGPIEEQSYIENILRLNKGKKARLHVTVPGSIEWQDRVFDGIIEQAGKDHVILSNPSTGEWYLILIIYLDFVTFEEPINYNKQFYT